MTPVFSPFPDLASEAQEAHVARLFLFLCLEAPFSPDIPDLFSFCFPLPYLSVYLFAFYFLMNSQQIAIQAQEKKQATLGQGMVDADPEPSPSAQVRLASSFYFLSYLGGDLFFIYFPVLV